MLTTEKGNIEARGTTGLRIHDFRDDPITYTAPDEASIDTLSIYPVTLSGEKNIITEKELTIVSTDVIVTQAGQEVSEISYTLPDRPEDLQTIDQDGIVDVNEEKLVPLQLSFS